MMVKFPGKRRKLGVTEGCDNADCTCCYENEQEITPRRGGLRRIGDSPSERGCRHPEHNPPGHRVYQPGQYEYTCPGCGKTITFTVNGATRM